MFFLIYEEIAMNEPAIKKPLDYQAYFMHDEKLCYIMKFLMIPQMPVPN